MELPTILTNDLMLLIVSLLAFAPILSGYATWKIGQVLFHDEERPRNRIIRRMFMSGLSISVASVYVAALCIGYIISFINGAAPNADFGGLTFALVLLFVFLQPFLNWLSLRALNGGKVDIQNETQDQREDRQFGTERRKLEEQHRVDRE